MIENKSLQSIDNNNNINISMNHSNDSIIRPIIKQLIDFGFNPVYSRRIFFYYHPQNVEDALDYLSLENGIIQHNFVQDRINNENITCYLCGESKDIHLNSNINNSINTNINIDKSNTFVNDNNSENKENDENDKNIINASNIEDKKDNFENNNEKVVDKILENSIENKSNENKINFNSNNSFGFNLNDTFELLKKKKMRIECKACLEMFCRNDKNTLKSCKHSFCNDCWYNYLSIKIQENKLASIKCLDYECQEKPDDIFIFNILYSNPKLIEKYKKFKIQLEIINDPNKKLCPFPNCDSYLELKNEKDKYVKCLNNHEFCYICLNKPHGNMPCINMSTSLVEYEKKNFVKKCPKCSIITEKFEGCNHITCSKCNHQWCWLCNGDYDPEHYYQGKCKGFQFFRPKDEEDIKLAFEGKIELRESQIQEDLDEDDLELLSIEEISINPVNNSLIVNNNES